MTKEEKQLLLIDLCARLPYGLKVKCEKYTFPVTILYAGNIYEVKFAETGGIEHIGAIKPYLLPMSSMTEEEYKEFSKISGLLKSKEDNYFSNHLPEWGNSIITERVMVRTIDWLNSHYFDYRGLIPMGLALEAQKDMYKIESL